MTMKIQIDPIACTGHGLCADLLPELVELDEWGYPMLPDHVPAVLAAHARRAVSSCPALALKLVRTSREQERR
jgi:ferredoxin